MIGTISIECNAKNPNMPLWPLRAYVNSPSSLRICNVPKKIGQWQITSVQVNVNYPDKTLKTAQCVLVGGVWVGTIEGSSATGSYTNGYTVLADGTDENGNPVSGYVLGRGDVEILKEDGTPIADAPTHFVTDDEMADALSYKADNTTVDEVRQDLDTLSTSLNTNYYTKSETSSAVELNEKFDTKTDLTVLNDYYTKTETSSAVEILNALDGKQPTGDYALTSQLPTKMSELSNDSGFITSAQVEPATYQNIYPAFAQNAVAATQLNAFDTQTALVADKAIFNAYVSYNQSANTYDLVLKGEVAVPNNWYISKLFNETFSQSLTLSWRRGTIYRKRVIGGTPRWSVTYTGWMWLLNGRYAMTASAEGEEDGKLYVLNYEDETHPNYINDPATDVHTLTFTLDGFTKVIATIDGQTGQATGSRNTLNSRIAFTDDLAYVHQLSAKADLSSLSDYYVKSETSSATEIQTALDTKQPVGNYLTAHQSLEDYYTKSETSSATELSTAFDNKQDNLSAVQLSAIEYTAFQLKTIVTYTDQTEIAYDIFGALHKDDIYVEGKDIMFLNVGKGVTSIASEGFASCTELYSVVLADSVEEIGRFAFDSCTSLTHITLPKNIRIGYEAFYGCTYLRDITLPDGTITDAAIFDSSGIQNVTVEDVKMLYSTTFYSCQNLSSVTVVGKTSQEVQSMGNYPWGISDTSIIKTWNAASKEWVLEQLAILSTQLQGGN